MNRWNGMLVALTLAGVATPARAQAPGAGATANLDGLTVAGKGTVGARPNRLEIDVEVTATSEMTSDVIVKYRDAKRRLQEAFAALKLGNIAVEERALAVDQKGQAFNPYFMDTAPAKRNKVEVQLTRKLVVACNNIRELDEETLLQLVARLLDVAQDAGAKVGGPQADAGAFFYGGGNSNNGLVRFILDDFDAARDQAYEAAVADARSRATRLAKLGGIELGPIAGVREVIAPGEKPAGQPITMSFYGAPAATEDEVPRRQITSAKFQEIPVKVELQVRFATAPGKGTARGVGQ